MRLASVLLAVLAAACASSPPAPPPPPEPEVLVALAAAELARDGSPKSEEILAAAGHEAVPWLVALSRSESERVRRRAQSLLISKGLTEGMTGDEQVQVLLFDVARSSESPCTALLALARLRALGASALPALRAAADGAGSRSETARTLLALLGEAPR